MMVVGTDKSMPAPSPLAMDGDSRVPLTFVTIRSVSNCTFVPSARPQCPLMAESGRSAPKYVMAKAVVPSGALMTTLCLGGMGLFERRE